MQSSCFHCGLDIASDVKIQAFALGKQRSFCCLGCSAVAEAIVENGLESYYQYRSEFANKPQENPNDILSSLKVFDDDSFLHDFVDSKGELNEIQLTISGIHCAACGWLIEKQLSKITGLKKVGVNVSARRANVIWDSKYLKLSDILTYIEKIGYHGQPFQPDQHEASFQQENKDFLKRLGLAGLMTMQVMMLNIGVFFDLFGHIDEQAKQYFNWVSLLLATPVMVFSASEFYAGAGRAIRAKTVNMDVPISLALILTYVSGVFATAQNNGQTYFESLCMFVFFLLISRYLEHSARFKASQLTANMLKHIPTSANLIEGQRVTPVLAKALRLNQIVLVKAGEMVPIDGVIVSGNGQLDEAMLTGEFDLVSKRPGDPVYAGTLNQLGTLHIEVTKTIKHSVVNQISLLQAKALLDKPKIASLADQFAQYFVLAVLAISVTTYIIWLQIDPSQALWITICVLIATCPCALGLATPSALSFAVAHLNSQGVLLKRADALEKIAKVDWMGFDKTGTLTAGKFTLLECKLVAELEKSKCLQIAASLERYSSHPIAQAFNHISESLEVTQFSATIAKGIQGEIEGNHYQLGSASFVPYSIPIELQECNLFLCNQDNLLAGFILADEIRPEGRHLIQAFSDKIVTLLSGDQRRSVSKVADKLNIPNWFAHQSPEDKLSVIQKAQSAGHTVLMVGDGINDGPVLAQADVSVTLGAGSDLAKSSADVILLDNSLEKLKLVFTIAKRCKHKIIQNILWAVGYNVLVLPLAVTGLLSPWMAVIGMSVSSLIVVVNSIRLLK